MCLIHTRLPIQLIEPRLVCYSYEGWQGECFCSLFSDGIVQLFKHHLWLGKQKRESTWHSMKGDSDRSCRLPTCQTNWIVLDRSKYGPWLCRLFHIKHIVWGKVGEITATCRYGFKPTNPQHAELSRLEGRLPMGPHAQARKRTCIGERTAIWRWYLDRSALLPPGPPLWLHS